MAVHLPVPHVRLPHACVPPLQVCVQSPVVHVIALHAPGPVHVRVQSALVQLMLPHAPVVEQVTLQLAAVVQVTDGQLPAVEHVMLQFQPAGQVMGVALPVIEHDIVVKSQVPPQIAGQTGASRNTCASTGREPMTQ